MPDQLTVVHMGPKGVDDFGRLLFMVTSFVGSGLAPPLWGEAPKSEQREQHLQSPCPDRGNRPACNAVNAANE